MASPNGMDIQIFDQITKQFMVATEQWFGAIQSFGITLALLLTLLQLILRISNDVVNGRADAYRIMTKTLSAVIILSIIYYFLMNANVILPSLFNTATKLGLEGSGVTSLDPSSVVSIGEAISAALLQGFHAWGVLSNIAAAIFGSFASIVTLLAFAFVAADLMITLILTYFFVSISGVFIAFGASSWTLPIAKQYFSGAIGTSIKLMLTYAMISIGANVANQWIMIANQASNTGNWEEFLGIAVAAAVYWYLVKKIPELFAGIASTSLGMSYIADTKGMVMALGSAAMAGGGLVFASKGKAATASTIHAVNSQIGASNGMSNNTGMHTAGNINTSIGGSSTGQVTQTGMSGSESTNNLGALPGLSTKQNNFSKP